MQLIGQYDSPFVRRVGIAMARYGMTFRQEPWSVWADADALAKWNPLRRVPVPSSRTSTGTRRSGFHFARASASAQTDHGS